MIYAIFAAIQQVEPTAYPLIAIMLSSVAMYAIGILLPCSSCCGCSVCVAGKLPDTVTVTVSGYVDGQLKTEQLGFVNFSSDFGSGAAAIITQPVGSVGPITEVSVTNGGSGYARLARVQPQIEIVPPAIGSGATFDVQLEQFVFNGRAAWRIASVSVTNGGSGYFSTPRFFGVRAANGVTTLEGGFSAGVSVGEPNLSLTITDPGTGTGAVLTPILTQFQDFFSGETRWAPNAIAVQSPGSGYEAGLEVRIVLGPGAVGNTAWRAYITEVDVNGGIVSVTVPFEYRFYSFYGTTGTITSVTVQNPGNFYRDDPVGPGEIAAITATAVQYLPSPPGGLDPGASGAVLAAVVDNTPASVNFGKITGVTVTNGGTGYRAWGYRPQWCCADYWNGKTIVLKRKRDGQPATAIPRPDGQLPTALTSADCIFSKLVCGVTYDVANIPASVLVAYSGPSEKPTVLISSTGADGCHATLTSTTTVADCDEFSFTATSPDGVTATVTAGGDYDVEESYNTASPSNCFACCRDLDDVPQEVSAKLYRKNAQTNAMELVGTFVLSRFGNALWRFVGRLQPSTPANSLDTEITVGIGQCNRLPWGSYSGVLQGGSYPGDPVGCSDCWKKCTVVASYVNAKDLRADTGNSYYGYRSDQCSGCVTSPMCAPAAGTKQLRLIQVDTNIVLNGAVGDYAIEVEP